MKRTTVVLDEQVDRELSQLARKQGHSKAELIRQTVKSYLRHNNKTRSIPRSVGIVSQDISISDIAEQLDDNYKSMLDQEYQDIVQNLNQHESTR